PRLVFVNKMDKLGADYYRCVEMIEKRLATQPVSIQLPIGAEDGFEGVADLVRMQAIYWNQDDQGRTFEAREIPDHLKAEAEQYREAMVEAAAEANESLMEKYLEESDLSAEDIKAGLHERVLTTEICLCMCGTAFKNKGG